MAGPYHDVFELANVVVVFLLAVVLVAVRYGRGPAVLAAFLSVAAFDFLYVPPRFSFSVSDVQYVDDVLVMLIVALVIGQLTAVLRWQARVHAARGTRAARSTRCRRDLSARLVAEQIAEIAARFIGREFEATAGLMVVDEADQV